MNDMSAEPILPTTSPEADQAQLLQALMAFRRGDFTVRLPVDGAGMHGKIADEIGRAHV